MKKAIILIIGMLCISLLYGCGNAKPEKPESSDEIAVSEKEEEQEQEAEVPTPASVETPTGAAAASVIPASLVFASDGNGSYQEPILGDWEAFLNEVFKSYEVGEIDPGSGNIKYLGEGNDGYGYCFIVTTRSDSSGIVSYNIDTAIISSTPNSGGEEVSGQTMVRWIYDQFNQ